MLHRTHRDVETMVMIAGLPRPFNHLYATAGERCIIRCRRSLTAFWGFFEVWMGIAGLTSGHRVVAAHTSRVWDVAWTACG